MLLAPRAGAVPSFLSSVLQKGSSAPGMIQQNKSPDYQPKLGDNRFILDNKSLHLS